MSVKSRYPKKCGWANGDEKEKLLYYGKGLIFPSLWYEGSPLTILEMKSKGGPCIVPDRCAAAEEIEDGVTGFVFKTGDIHSLKQAIMKCEEADILTLQKNILSTFNADDYTPKTHTRNLLNIYSEILNN